mmetsp:Transcript_107659/g.270065  ORF Transcript_107659/g.270065 Transcript_107659/m.270065 type:complete len:339 (+) Transcript_107659:12-1028(+)
MTIPQPGLRCKSSLPASSRTPSLDTQAATTSAQATAGAARCHVARTAGAGVPCSLALSSLPACLQQTQLFRCNLELLIHVHVAKVVVNGHLQRRRVRLSELTRLAAHIGHVLLLAHIDRDILLLVVDANAHAGIDLLGMLNKEQPLVLHVEECVAGDSAISAGDDGSLLADALLLAIVLTPACKTRGHYRRAFGPLHELPLHANEAPCRDLEGKDHAVLNRATLHSLHDRTLLVHLLKDHALELSGDLDDCLLVGLLLRSSIRIFLEDNLRRTDHELVALTSHVLHEDTQLQGAAAFHAKAIPTAGLNAECEVGQHLSVQPVLDLRGGDKLALLALTC